MPAARLFIGDFVSLQMPEVHALGEAHTHLFHWKFAKKFVGHGLELHVNPRVRASLPATVETTFQRG
jgi:hypothetical protein